jgi:four helix bundle protein
MWRRGWWRNWRRRSHILRPRPPTRTRPRSFRSAANLPPPLTPPPPFAVTESPPPFAMPASRQFDHEKLQVYQLELEFIAWLTDLFAEVQAAKVPRLAEVLDQLDRASLSALLNTAEGNGRRATQQRVKFFDDARGSCTECAACLDALVAKRACKKERVFEGKDMLLSIVSILSALISRFEKPSSDSPRSSGGGVRVGGRGGLPKP